MDVSNLRYIFPNSFTLASVFCSFTSMYVASTATSASQLSVAAWLILVSMICDLVDGRVARLTKAQSEFGVQLDSLADAVSFGIAPAWLMFQWGLKPLGIWGILAAFVYVACTLIRLARFNVLAGKDDTGTKAFFMGLPSPLAAGGVIAVVLAHLSVQDQMTTNATFSVVILSVLLGGLMVSNVPYRTFKNINFRGKAGIALVILLGLAIFVGLTFNPSYSIVMLMLLYIVMGIIGGIVNLGKMLFIHDDAEEGILQKEDDFAVFRDDEA